MTATSSVPPLVGMIHLGPLPGSPRFTGSITEVIEDAVVRAETLVQAGFSTLMVENFGDTPFFADSVPPVTIAAITRAVTAIRSATPAAVGVNVLRNDALSALAVAAVTGATMIRVNVLSGSMNTDQGPIVGRAAEVARTRRTIAAGVQVWADVFVKHAAPPAGLSLEQATADTWERAGADALIVSGTGTGSAPDLDHIRRVRSAAPEAPLVIGSGATAENLAELTPLVDGIIVGTALERDGRPGAPLDPARVERFIDSAQRSGLL